MYLRNTGNSTRAGSACGRYRGIRVRTFTRVYRNFNTSREILFKRWPAERLAKPNQLPATMPSAYARCCECLSANGTLDGYIVLIVGVAGGRRRNIWSSSFETNPYTTPFHAWLKWSERACMHRPARRGTNHIAVIFHVRRDSNRVSTNSMSGVHDQPSCILDIEGTSSGRTKCSQDLDIVLSRTPCQRLKNCTMASFPDERCPILVGVLVFQRRPW